MIIRYAGVIHGDES